jgi:hypothetical protein
VNEADLWQNVISMTGPVGTLIGWLAIVVRNWIKRQEQTAAEIRGDLAAMKSEMDDFGETLTETRAAVTMLSGMFSKLADADPGVPVRTARGSTAPLELQG